MIVTRTPLRISFFGGGTDFYDFYKKDYGAVIGTTIDKYVYVLANSRFESEIRASYSKTEIVKNSSKIQHPLIREGLLHYKIKNGLELVTIADVPGTGTGLGSSSSTMVGILHTLGLFSKKRPSKHYLAKNSSDIEINKLKEPIGKQDQYFASFGGLSYIKFNSDRTVKVSKVNISNKILSELEENILCFYTGIRRKSSKSLSYQKKNIPQNFKNLLKIREQADLGLDLLKSGDLTQFGILLDDAWTEKKKLSPFISNPTVDSFYKKAIDSGALGGKLNGGGYGGFLTFYCEKKYHSKVRTSLKELTELKLNFENKGTIQLISKF